MLEKIANVWAASGTTDEPDAPKKTVGFAGADQPAMERFNWLHNLIQTKVNEIVSERLSGLYEDAAAPTAMLTTKLFDEPWGLTDDDVNTLSGGSGKSYVDLGVYFDSTANTPRLLALDRAGNSVDVYDPRALTALDASGDLTSDLPSGSGETWEALSMATDGTYVYITFVDTNSDEYQVQSWLISDWSVNTGWSATGTALPGSGTPSLGYVPASIKIVSATKLAVLNNWITVSAASSTALSIIDSSDGSITASGAGDCPTGDSCETYPGLASDGTNVFFGTRGSTGRYLCSATIANPQVGCGGTGYPLTISTPIAGQPNFLSQCGPNLIAAPISVYSGHAITDAVLHTCNADEADLGEIVRGQNGASSPLPADEWFVQTIYDSRYDGINLWLACNVRDLSGSNSAAVVKIDASKLPNNASSNKTPAVIDIASCFRVGSNVMSGDTALGRLMSLEFDGRDLWIVKENRPSQTDSGKIFRLPLALLRS
jgi:hypothetical protein